MASLLFFETQFQKKKVIQPKLDAWNPITEWPSCSNLTAGIRIAMPTDAETRPLLKRSSSSLFSHAKEKTPEFGRNEYWILNFSCLLTITLLSIWQVTGKVAISLNLDSSEVCWFRIWLVAQRYIPDLLATEVSETHFLVLDALSRVGILFSIFTLEPRGAASDDCVQDGSISNIWRGFILVTYICSRLSSSLLCSSCASRFDWCVFSLWKICGNTHLNFLFLLTSDLT